MKGCGRKIGPFDCCTVVQGDCLDVMAEIPNAAFRLIITSPPYNNYENKRHGFGPRPAWRQRDIEYGDFKDEMPEDKYQAWQQVVIKEMLRITAKDGTVAYNHKNRIRNWGIISPLEWIKPVANIRQEIIWDRGNSPQVSPVRFLPTTERLYLLGDGKPYFNGDHLSDGEVWRIPPRVFDGIPAFPEKLIVRMVDALSEPRDRIADLFMGKSGTVPIVAKSMGRHFFGCDINPEYVAMAEERLSTTQLALGI